MPLLSITPRLPARPDTSLAHLCERLGVDPADPTTLPCTPEDLTVGTEDELQSTVFGSADAVDLARTIRESAFYANSARHAAAGSGSARIVSELDAYLLDGAERGWDHSWVRFPYTRLNAFARAVLDADLRGPAAGPPGAARSDAHRYRITEAGEDVVRLPASAALRLALAQALGHPETPPALRELARPLLGHFGNDNTSPETYSFAVQGHGARRTAGEATARETARRYLLTQALAAYANDGLGLRERGQLLAAYFSPHPPERLRQLNRCVSDAFYRELFMNPCLAGWADGEAKSRYMALCHEVLSRSRLNALGKLRDAGIIANDLVVLPNTSTVSLANNGTHVSLGSRRLGRRIEGGAIDAADEKLVGDFVVKIVEHFLPLFVGTYSAAPMRLDFEDFHPELALGYLPHQLDYTHLRQLWLAWREKARLRVAGRAVTPFGPRALDRTLAAAFRLRGDLVPDGRLLDYPVALLSTERSPALDGSLGNGDRLKRDLTALGVFDARMSLYVPYRLRAHATMGFSGFEGRLHSLFPSLADDLAPAVTLQALVTAFAWQCAASGAYGHADIPDTPTVESERRQFLFAAAAGVPAVYVHQRTPNRFLRAVVDQVSGARRSVRQPGYLKVPLAGYCAALLDTLRRDAAGLVACFDAGPLLDDARARVAPRGAASASARLVAAIADEAGGRDPFAMRRAEFAAVAERAYRGTVRDRHVDEAFGWLSDELRDASRAAAAGDPLARLALGAPNGDAAAGAAGAAPGLPADLPQLQRRLRDGVLPEPDARRLVRLLVATILLDRRASCLTSDVGSDRAHRPDDRPHATDDPSVHRPHEWPRTRRTALRGSGHQLPLFHGA